MENTEMITLIAMVCHQANKAWCEANGDDSQPNWIDAPKWQQESAINGVRFRIENPDAKPDAQHKNWMKAKKADGWVYGEVKDPEAKTHPCIVAFDDLPEFQKRKDLLFAATVDALAKEFFVFMRPRKVFMEKEEILKYEIKADKLLRVGLDGQLQNLKSLYSSRERTLAITKTQEAIMWLGKDLQRLGGPSPYPNSYDPGNSVIDPTADNLKL